MTAFDKIPKRSVEASEEAQEVQEAPKSIEQYKLQQQRKKMLYMRKWRFNQKLKYTIPGYSEILKKEKGIKNKKPDQIKRKEYNKKYYDSLKNNPEKHKKQILSVKKWKLKNPEKVSQYNKKCYNKKQRKTILENEKNLLYDLKNGLLCHLGKKRCKYLLKNQKGTYCDFPIEDQMSPPHIYEMRKIMIEVEKLPPYCPYW